MYKAVVLALAALAVAKPCPDRNPPAETTNICGNGNTIHCCEQKIAKQLQPGGLIGVAADLGNLLGQCNEITAAVLGAAVPLHNQCTQQAVCCGKNNQGGLINISCSPITL